jgi:hypothetical protein
LQQAILETQLAKDPYLFTYWRKAL